MGRKVFVSYKYKDNDVKIIPDVIQPTWPCDYVDYIQNKVLSSDDIYKGEKSDVIAMRPYLDEVYSVDNQRNIILLFDTRSFKYRNLITFKKFQKQIQLIKPRQ